MGGKIAGFLATLFLSIPLAAIGLMAVFGIPQLVPASSHGERSSVFRDVQDRFSNWGKESSPDNDAPGYEEPTVFGQNAPFNSNSAPGWNTEPATGSGEMKFASNNASNIPPRELESRPFNDVRQASMSENTMNSGGPRPADFEKPSMSWGNQSPSPRGSSSMSAPNAGNSSTANERRLDSRFDSTPNSMRSNSPVVNNISSGEAQPLGSSSLSWSQASAKLNDMGINDFHLERGAKEGSFLFVCLYTPNDKVKVTHRFEFEADDPLFAVNQTLRQVDEFMQKRFVESNFPSRSKSFSMSSTNP